MSGSRLLKDIVAHIAEQALEELTETRWSRGKWHTNSSGQRIMIQTREGHIIAIIGQSQVGKSKAQANAELIKSAPELYQALEDLTVGAYDPEEGDCLICGAECAWGAGPHDGECEVAVAAAVLALARGETR